MTPHGPRMFFTYIGLQMIVAHCESLTSDCGKLVYEHPSEAFVAQEQITHTILVSTLSVYVHCAAIFFVERYITKRMEGRAVDESCHAVLRCNVNKFLAVRPLADIFEVVAQPIEHFGFAGTWHSVKYASQRFGTKISVVGFVHEFP